MGFLLLVLLVALVAGAWPRWNHSRDWGYGPTGGLGVLLLILVILMLMGRIRTPF